jgi:hypothetical protein
MAAQRGGPARPSLDRPALAALVLGLAGIGYRLVLLLLGVPGSNSDEAAFALAAMHIAQGRSAPIYMYGQHYMGAVESYLAAPLFAAFGPSWALLRIPVLLLYAIFIFLMYRLTRSLYSSWFAVFIVGLLAFGSERTMRDQMTAVGGRPESKPAVVLLLLIAVALGQRRPRHRALAFGAFGLVAGLTVWDDWLVLPYVAVAALLLLVGSGRELFGRHGALALGGFVLGLLPLIVDNIIAPPGHDSLSVFLLLNHAGAGRTTPAEQVRGAVLIGVPLASGLCPASGCAPWQAAWGILYPLLLLAAAVLASVGLRRPAPPVDRPDLAEAPVPQLRIRYAAQLALAVAAGLTLLSYARSPAAGLTPTESARYLTVLQISLPAALWPLWLAAAASWRRASAWLRLSGAVPAGLLIALTTAMLATTTQQIAAVPAIRAEEQRSRALASAVRQSGIRYAYTDYWTCHRLVFITREGVVCAVLTDNLRPGQNRHHEYLHEVTRAPRPAFIFETESAGDHAFRKYLDGHDIQAPMTEVGGYRIYQPEVQVRPW